MLLASLILAATLAPAERVLARYDAHEAKRLVPMLSEVIRFPTYEHNRSEEHTSELQSLAYLVCRLLLDPPPPQIHTLSLHDALPIFPHGLIGPAGGILRYADAARLSHPRRHARSGRARPRALRRARGKAPRADAQRGHSLPDLRTQQIGRAHV